MTGAKEQAKRERRGQVLLAADSFLRSRAVDWGRLFTYDELSAETGLDRKQIADDFGSKAHIVDALIDFYLSPGNNDLDNWLTNFTAQAESILADRSLSFTEGLRTLATVSHDHARRDRRQTGRLALWSLARGEPAVSSRLRILYDYYGSEYVAILRVTEEWFASRGIRPRPGLTTEQFIVGFTAITEGLGIRAEFDEDAVPPELPGTLLIALTEAYFTDADDPADDAIGSRLAAWEKAKNA